MSAKCSIVWFRQDLRLADNPALAAAIQRGGAVIPLYIWSPDEEGDWSPGAASRWWLHHSLESLSQKLMDATSRLLIRKEPTQSTLAAIVRQTGSDAVFWNRRYEPAAIARDAKIKESLRSMGVHTQSFNGSLLIEPWEITTKTGGPFQVFTPFWKACLGMGPPTQLISQPKRIPAPSQWPCSLELADLKLLPTIDWARGMRQSWRPGVDGAAHQLRSFVSNSLENYAEDRDKPGITGSSRLSPHLHFGELSPRMIWHAVTDVVSNAQSSATMSTKNLSSAAEVYLREIGWREFAHHLLYHFPKTTSEPLRDAFRRFPWRRSAKRLNAWQKGMTGYPIVDAGMRELWSTGWMHNRVRMIVASFLVKHLLIPWHEGARWFWDTLVDADLANNTLGWQWTAGCGADAAPFFRVFNPVLQGEKFDAEGTYVRQWVPELGTLENRWIHKPWEAPEAKLLEAGVDIGTTYPAPMVDHQHAREDALRAFESIKNH